jgi:nucleoside-diphosphate-sugar epimerase
MTAPPTFPDPAQSRPRILLTGGSGFLGKIIATELLSAGSPVITALLRIFDRNVYSGPADERVEYVKGDVCDADGSQLATCVLRPADIYGEDDPFHIGPLINMAKGGFYVGIAILARPLKNYTPKFSRFAVIYTCTDFTFSSAKAKKDFGFVPKYSMENAILRTIKHYRIRK